MAEKQAYMVICSEKSNTILLSSMLDHFHPASGKPLCDDFQFVIPNVPPSEFTSNLICLVGH